MFGIGCAVSAVAFIAIIISFAATSASSYALLFAGAQFDLFASAIPTSGLAIVSNTFAIASFLFSAAYFKTPMLCTPEYGASPFPFGSLKSAKDLIPRSMPAALIPDTSHGPPMIAAAWPSLIMQLLCCNLHLPPMLQISYCMR